MYDDSGFRDLIRHQFEHVALDKRYFAESAIVRDRGESRPITVIVRTDQDLTEAGQGSSEVETIYVRCSRIPGVDRELGYLAQPIAEETELLRGADKDPRQVAYKFTGRVDSQTDTHWVLVFERANTFRQRIT